MPHWPILAAPPTQIRSGERSRGRCDAMSVHTVFAPDQVPSALHKKCSSLAPCGSPEAESIVISLRQPVGTHLVRVNSPVLVNSAEPIFTMKFAVFVPKYWAVSGFHTTSCAKKLAPFSSVPDLSGKELMTFPS